MIEKRRKELKESGGSSLWTIILVVEPSHLKSRMVVGLYAILIAPRTCRSMASRDSERETIRSGAPKPGYHVPPSAAPPPLRFARWSIKRRETGPGHKYHPGYRPRQTHTNEPTVPKTTSTSILPGGGIRSDKHVLSLIFGRDEQEMGGFPDGMGMGHSELLEPRSEFGKPWAGRKSHIRHLSSQDFPRLSFHELVNVTRLHQVRAPSV